MSFELFYPIFFALIYICIALVGLKKIKFAGIVIVGCILIALIQTTLDQSQWPSASYGLRAYLGTVFVAFAVIYTAGLLKSNSV